MVIGSSHKDLSIKGSKDWQATTGQPHVIGEGDSAILWWEVILMDRRWQQLGGMGDLDEMCSSLVKVG